MMLPHQTQNPLLVHRHLRHKVQLRPDATVAPKRVLRFELLDLGQPTFIVLGRLERAGPRQPSSSSPFF
jgi:hypothetical protein